MRRLLLPAPATLELLETQRDVYIDEILKRTQLLIGSIDSAVNRYGIVDSQDPTTSLEGDTRPFVVRVNATDSATVDVLGGTAVFSTGEVITLSDGASRLAVPGGVGTKSVVYLNFDERFVDNTLTRYETYTSSRVDFLETNAEYIQITTTADYEALTFAERENTILLAQITVQEVISGAVTSTELVVDMGESALTTNRPWFTPVDLEHRSFLGTGTSSVNNPHALSLNDLSANSGFSLFQLNLDHGMIVSKDETLAKVPGKVCEEEILSGAIFIDSAGSVTGVMGALWFRTSNFPTQIVRATDPQKLFDYAPVRLPRSNIVFLLPNDQYIADTNIFVYYMTTDACEPPTDLPLTSLDFKAAGTREAIITSGIVQDVVDTAHSFEDAGPTPQRFTVYMDDSGTFKRYPHALYCFKRIADIGFTIQAFTSTPVGLGRVKVALTNAVASLTMQVDVQITGTDSTGSIVTEIVTFGSSWANNPVGTCSELDAQFVYTTNYFTTLSNFIITTSTDAGPDAALSFFSDVSPRDTEALADILPVSEVVWDGLQVCSLEDIRPINTTMHLPKVSKYAAAGIPLAETTSIMRPGYIFNFWVEDFDQPKFIATEFSDTTTSPGLSALSTDMRKEEDGLHKLDRYVGKPIAVRPHLSNPQAIRFVPIEPDRSFTMWARYFDGTGAWTDWTALSSFASPQYTIDLLAATSPLIKWQIIVSGECKGMITTYISDGPGLTPSFVYDVGVWDSGTFT